MSFTILPKNPVLYYVVLSCIHTFCILHYKTRSSELFEYQTSLEKFQPSHTIVQQVPFHHPDSHPVRLSLPKDPSQFQASHIRIQPAPPNLSPWKPPRRSTTSMAMIEVPRWVFRRWRVVLPSFGRRGRSVAGKVMVGKDRWVIVQDFGVDTVDDWILGLKIYTSQALFHTSSEHIVPSLC